MSPLGRSAMGSGTRFVVAFGAAPVLALGLCLCVVPERPPPPPGQPALSEMKVIPVDLDLIEDKGRELKGRFAEIFQ
jgi:hypothetical protein